MMGFIELDETLQRRTQQLKASREALFIDLAGVRRATSLLAVEYLKASQVEVFGKLLRENYLPRVRLCHGTFQKLPGYWNNLYLVPSFIILGAPDLGLTEM